MARKTSFYYAFLVLPADQRRAIIAVWDFCRAVDGTLSSQSPLRNAAGRAETIGENCDGSILGSLLYFIGGT